MAHTMQTASMGPLLMNSGNQVMTQIEIWMASSDCSDQRLNPTHHKQSESAFQGWFPSSPGAIMISPTCKTHINQQVTELLKRGVPIWPTQLRWYTKSFLQSLGHDYNVLTMKTNPIIGLEGRDGWEEFIHPLGATYSYNAKMKTYTEMNIRTCSDEQVHRLESWIDVSRTKLNGQEWLLIVELVLVGGEEIYPYYYVVPEKHIITWLELLDGYFLFQECTAVWHWNHKRLELEAQFWKHVEYFPCGIKIRVSEVRALRIQLNWYRIETEALALEQSTVASIFWTLDQMKEMVAELAIAVDDQRSEELAEPDGTMKEQGITICSHHKYLNHHGQPKAHLMRTHSLGERRTDLETSPFVTSIAFTMLYIPTIMLRHIRNIYVDGLINRVDMRNFMDNFSAQAKAQTTVASVIMAVNASILAIPILGSQLATKMLCSISFIFSAHYLQGRMGYYSLVFSIVRFLAGIFTVEYGLPLSARIACGLSLIVGMGLVIPLAVASLGPGLIR
ncbi:uncharacterized protein EDB91DRAFT_1088422 [Suillus paluster]|uniref:uncharacterized protein n=1 Tax=Suillus paluster TaxID=48578 RepID=UPI001B87B4E1|nr:uncharacterized protein EDB91DRAFT_1088422 [Suillus paluster]KAG1721500.1 hypothetical protein EDB91DRAFT_1088422 [Suillus paluster]